jgi:hypothetical protein
VFLRPSSTHSRSHFWAHGPRADALVGKWTEKEQSLLIECIKDVNTALGHDPLSAEAPWEIVCEKMGRTRTTTQCRKKWYVIEPSEPSEHTDGCGGGGLALFWSSSAK